MARNNIGAVIRGAVNFSPVGPPPPCHVSNGERIVAVSRSGRYELPWVAGRHRFVFVIPPDGYRAVGRFWRHEPIDPSQPIDFELRRFRHRRGDFSILHVTDFHVVEKDKPEPGPSGVPADFPTARELKKILTDVLRQTPRIDFVLATGDLTNAGDERSLAAVARVFKSLPFVIYPIFGGHDGNVERFAQGSDRYNVAEWTRHLAPPYYSWHWRGRHFVSHVSEDTHFLDQTTRQMHDAFVAEDMRLFGKRMPVTVCSHKNPFPWNEGVFQKHRVDSWFHGHFHSNRVMQQGRIRVFSTSSAAMGGLDVNVAPARIAMFSPRGAPTSRIVVPQPLKMSHPAKAKSKSYGGPVAQLWSNRSQALARLSAPCVTDDRVYCGIVDDSAGTDGGVACFNLKNGRTRWTARLPGSVESPVVHDGGQIFAVTQTGLTACLDARTGRIVWRHELANAYDRWICSPPLVHRGALVVGTTSCLACLNARNGQKKWEFHDRRKSSDAFGQFQGAVAQGDRIFLAGYRTGSFLIDIASGKVHRCNEDRDRRYSSRVVPDGSYYVVGDGEGSLTCFDLSSGQRRWSRRISDNSISSAFVPFGADDLVGGTAEGVVRLSQRDGRVLARRRFDRDIGWFVPYRRELRSCPDTPCVVGPQRCWIASGDGYLNRLDGSNLRVTRRMKLPAPVIGGLSISPTQFLLGVSIDGTLRCWKEM